MGAAEWAANTAAELQEEFVICEERALRFTTLVRGIISREGYRHFRSKDDARDRTLTDDLTAQLREQPGQTPEARWNNLMDELNAQQYFEDEVYLIPWERTD
jgi:hypothetical protein